MKIEQAVDIVRDVTQIATERNAAWDYIKKLEEINKRLLETINNLHHSPKPIVVCELCHAKLIEKKEKKDE